LPALRSVTLRDAADRQLERLAHLLICIKQSYLQALFTTDHSHSMMGGAHRWGLDIFSIQDRVPRSRDQIGVGVGVGIGIDPDTDSDPDTDGNQEQTDRQQPGSRRRLSQTMKKYP
jgi:hypothetical protein